MGHPTTAALVGATGGAGTTRLAVETAVLLADRSKQVAVLDAAYGTQGLRDHLDGRLYPDITALVTEDVGADLSAGLVDLGVSGDGRVACCPAAAPFERLARAKQAGAARRLEERIVTAAERFDAVLLDVGPLAANQHVAAVNAADRVGIVARATTRGADATERVRARLLDIDASVDAAIATRGERAEADASVPETTAGPPAATAGGAFDAGVADVAETLLEIEIDVDETRGALDAVRERF